MVDGVCGLVCQGAERTWVGAASDADYLKAVVKEAIPCVGDFVSTFYNVLLVNLRV